VHGEEDTERQAGRSYLMLEGTDGQVHYIYYTPEMEEARSRGELRANSFVRLRKQFSEGHPAPKIEGPGDSDAILRNQAVSEKPCRASIGGGLPRERTDGTDGSGTTRRHFTRSRQLWNANALRNDSSSKKTEAVDCDASVPVEMPTSQDLSGSPPTPRVGDNPLGDEISTSADSAFIWPILMPARR
jgi:hypothetical protein